jgi:HAMP domain-containing protein
VDAESQITRVALWLDVEQPAYWAMQLRKRAEAVSQAEEALRQKLLYKDSSGRTPTPVDEQRALAKAKRRLEEAQQRAANVQKYRRLMEKESQQYRGGVSRLTTTIQTDVPALVEEMDRMVDALDRYAALSAGGADAGAAGAGGPGVSVTAVGPGAASGRMARAADVAAPPLPPVEHVESSGRPAADHVGAAAADASQPEPAAPAAAAAREHSATGPKQ